MKDGFKQLQSRKMRRLGKWFIAAGLIGLLCSAYLLGQDVAVGLRTDHVVTDAGQPVTALITYCVPTPGFFSVSSISPDCRIVTTPAGYLAACASLADMDGDHDVDLADYALFQTAMTGPL